MIPIGGTTKVFAVLGNPVSHSLSPALYNAAFAALGLDAVYVALNVAPASLSHVLRGFEAAGVGGNVTVPHKIAAASLIVRLTDTAREVGAVNTFWSDGDRLVGDNTDVGGVVDAVTRLGADGPWLLAGTGGSARAVTAAARQCGVELLVQSRSDARATTFVEWAQSIGADATVDDGRGIGTAINTTPLGMQEDDPLPVATERLDGCRVALDLVYRPGETGWCHACRRQGLTAADGRGVLVGQGLRALERFFPEVDPPRAVMEAAVERRLGR